MRTEWKKRRVTASECVIEKLESRQLLAGVTVITHGYQLGGTAPAWLSAMGLDVQGRVGEQLPIYTIQINDDLSSSINRFNGTPAQDIENTYSGEAVVLVDWAAASGVGFLSNYHVTTSIASIVAAGLMTAYPSIGIQHPLAELPIHLVGHSRGGSVVSEVSRLLGQAGVVVDQQTTLDPCPVSPDPSAVVYENTIFADNYYQQNAVAPWPFNYYPQSAIAGAHNIDLDASLAALGGVNHTQVHAYYDGTIDLTATDDGDGTAIQPQWYQYAATGPRDSVDFAWSRIANAAPRPTDGLALYGAPRVAVTPNLPAGELWDNAVISGWADSVDVSRGDTVQIPVDISRWDGNATASVGVDTDENPYNGTIWLNYQSAIGDGLWQPVIDTSSLAPGTYHIVAAISNGVHGRYDYSLGELTVSVEETRFYDDGELALSSANPLGSTDPLVPLFHNGSPLGNFQVIEASDKVPGQLSWPLTYVDLISNTFLRATYQNSNGTSGSLGTSFVGTMSYRTNSGLQYVPAVSSANVSTGIPERMRVDLAAAFGTQATVTSSRTFPDPPIGRTDVNVDLGFTVHEDIALDPMLRGNDAFRLFTVSSMFASPNSYDANLIRWLGADGLVHTMALSSSTPRDSHLFTAPMEMTGNGWFELIKQTGSTWNISSPSIRVQLNGVSGFTGRLGLQGWLAPTTDPNDDSLSVWVEWMDAPANISAGSAFAADVTVQAFPGTDVDEIAPSVTAVYVRGSTWASGYLSFLAANTSGSSSTYGYAIPVGTGAAQLQTLPWRNLNRISLRFSEEVTVAQAQFAIVGSVGSYSVSGFAYSSADHVATWSLSGAIGPDKLYVAVPGSGASPIADLAGNVLDGEWVNPSSYSDSGSSDTFPSGNGSAGGDFAFRFDVLPGDSSGGSLGKVNVADVAQTKSRSGLPVSTSTYRSDFDGNNLVNVADVLYVKSKSSVYSLPVNPPVLPVFGPVSSQVNPLLFREDLLLGYA